MEERSSIERSESFLKEEGKDVIITNTAENGFIENGSVDQDMNIRVDNPKINENSNAVCEDSLSSDHAAPDLVGCKDCSKDCGDATVVNTVNTDGVTTDITSPKYEESENLNNSHKSTKMNSDLVADITPHKNEECEIFKDSNKISDVTNNLEQEIKPSKVEGTESINGSQEVSEHIASQESIALNSSVPNNQEESNGDNETKDVNTNKVEDNKNKAEEAAEKVFDNDDIEENVDEQLLQSEASSKSEDEYDDILGNGLLTKKVLKTGIGTESRPTHGQVVTLNVKGQLSDGTVIDEQDNLDFCIGDGDVIQALEIAVCLMEVEEVCELITDAKYAYGSQGSPPLIPADATITYNLELLKKTEAPDINSLSASERIEIGEGKRERGNQLFARNDYTAAINSYTKALNYLSPENLGSEGATMLQKVLDCRIKCHNNMAACQLKVEAYDAAIKSCREVLQSQPQNVKALFRVGKANAAKGETKDAIKYLKKAQHLDPESKIVFLELCKLSKKIQKETESEKLLYKKMFGIAPEPPKKEKTNYWWLIGIGGAALVAALSIFSYKNIQH